MVKCVEEEKGCKYLGLLREDEIKHVEMKKFISKKYFRSEGDFEVKTE